MENENNHQNDSVSIDNDCLFQKKMLVLKFATCSLFWL